MVSCVFVYLFTRKHLQQEEKSPKYGPGTSQAMHCAKTKHSAQGWQVQYNINTVLCLCRK